MELSLGRTPYDSGSTDGWMTLVNGFAGPICRRSRSIEARTGGARMHDRISVDLDTLLDLVHDRWFDLTECEFDREGREFRLSLADAPSGPYRDKLLRVTDVLDVQIRDKAETQTYDINEIHITPASVLIECSIPLEIELAVGEDSRIYITKYPSRQR
jgi:hypothetical protein